MADADAIIDDQSQPDWHDLANAAALEARRRSSVTDPEALRLVENLFKAFIAEYDRGIRVAASCSCSEEFATTWAGFLRQMDFETSYLTTLKALAEVDADAVTRHALQIRFSTESVDPFVNEALADLSSRIGSLLMANCLQSSIGLQRSTILALLSRAMSAPRNCAAYAHSWARTIGVVSVFHLELVLDAFRNELSQFEYKATFAPEAAGAFSMLTYIRVCIPDAPESANKERFEKVLDFHRTIFLSRSYKNPVPAVVLSHLTVLDIHLRQWAFILPNSDLMESFFRTSDNLSKLPLCKAAALALMSSLLERWPDSEWRQKNFEIFLNKRVLRHVSTPRKTAHCLRIILRILRGKYQPRVHLNCVDGDGLVESIVVHPQGSSQHFHPYAFRMRDFDSNSDSERLQYQLNRFSKLILNRKVLHLAWPRYKWELVEIIMQLAVHDAVWTLNHVVIPLLAWKKTNDHTELLLALEVCRNIFNEFGEFQRHALEDSKRETLCSTLALSVTSCIESVLSRLLFELGLSSPSERAQVALQVTSALETPDNSFLSDMFGGDPRATTLDNIEEDSDIDQNEGSDYALSPVKQHSAPRTTSTYTLRSGSSEFPFFETLPQAVTDNADIHRASVSPSSVAISDFAQIASHSSTDVAGNHSVTNLSRARSGELFVFVSAVRCLGVLPSSDAILDPQCAFFMLPMLLHQLPCVALATSHALQEMSANKDFSWFISVTNALTRFLSDISLHESASITTLLRQIIANVDFWSLRMSSRNADIPESCILVLVNLDSLALTYLGHHISMIRITAYQLCQCVKQCFIRLGIVGHWTLATWLAEKNTLLVLNAQVCLAGHAKVLYPGGAVRHDTSASQANESLVAKSKSAANVSSGAPAGSCSSKLNFRDLIFSDDPEHNDLISASLMVLVKLLFDEEEATRMLSHARDIITARLVSLFSQAADTICAMSRTLYFLLSFALSMKPKSDLGANNLLLSLWHFMLASNKDTALQKSAEFVLAHADVDHLYLLMTTLNQSRNDIFTNLSASLSVPIKKSSRRRGETQEILERTDRTEIESIWSRFLISLSEPKRLRLAFQSSQRVRVLYLEICRFGLTKSFRKWCRTPDHLSDRVQFLGNVCFALRRRHKYDGVDLSGPFLEADIPEWTRDDRSRTLNELRSWSECGEISTPSSEEMFSFLRSRWSMFVESQVHSMHSAGGKPLSDRDRAVFTRELLKRMEDQFTSKLADLRLRSFWCISRIFSLGPVLEDACIAEDNWLDWALQAESKSVPVLQMMICFHWKEMPKLLDRLYWETSENGPLSVNLFAACASQLVPVCFGLSSYMTRHELEDSVPLSNDDIVSQNLKRPLINDMLAPLVVCAIFHMGSDSSRIAQTSASMLARLCDILFAKNLTSEQVKSLSILRTHHPGLQSKILSIRCKNALIISRTVANLCSADMKASILNEVVLRWAQFHNSQWQQKEWFIDCFEPFFLALPFHRYSVIQSSESARLMLSDMINVTRSLVRDDAPALQSMLSIWQCFAGGRTEDNRLTNVHAIAAFILDEHVAIIQDDYIRAASLIAVELYRHSPLAVLDCILQSFEQLDVSLQFRSDPLSVLRIPAALLSSVLGARFQSCRPRLPSILHHTFLWISLPKSPCVRILHDILHHSNVVRGPSAVTPSSEGISNSLSGMIQPIPALENMVFQWNGDDCREWDVSDDSKILSMFQRIARCASAIYDAEFVIPIEFICKVVKRWVSRAFGDSTISDWASAAFHTAVHSPRTDLVLLSLRILSILSISNTLQSYLSMGGILASAVTRLEHRNRSHASMSSLDESIVLQILQICSSGISAISHFDYEQFRIFTFVFYQAALICLSPPTTSVLKSSLSLLQQCLKNAQFLKLIRMFPKDISCCRNLQDLTPDKFAWDFCNIGYSLSGFGYNGLQSIIVDIIIKYADSGDVLNLAFSVSLSFWDIPCDAILGLLPNARTSLILSFLPWFLYQTTSGTNIALAQHFAAKLASAIEESEYLLQFSELPDRLRMYASRNSDQRQAVDLLTIQLSEAFNRMSTVFCETMLYIARSGSVSLRSACFYIAAKLISESPSAVNALNELLVFALQSIPSQRSDDLCLFLQAVSVAAREWSPADSGSAINVTEGGPVGTLRSSIEKSASAGPALACLSADPTAFFAIDSQYTGHAIPGFEPVEGRKNSICGQSRSRFEARRGSFEAKSLPSPGTKVTDNSSKNNCNVIPVPCTLANLVDTPHLAEHFRKFVSIHGDVRNFDFYRAVSTELSPRHSTDFQSIDFGKAATSIVDRFLRGSAHTQIDVDSCIKKEIIDQLESNPSPTLFHKALQLVKAELMSSYTAFCDSSDYDRLVRSGQLVSP